MELDQVDQRGPYGRPYEQGEQVVVFLVVAVGPDHDQRKEQHNQKDRAIYGMVLERLLEVEQLSILTHPDQNGQGIAHQAYRVGDEDGQAAHEHALCIAACIPSRVKVSKANGTVVSKHGTKKDIIFINQSIVMTNITNISISVYNSSNHLRYYIM